MNIIQKKLMEYNHGYFMAIGLTVFMIGFFLQLLVDPTVLHPASFQILTVLGALILGWGTGRCDQCAMPEKE
ncbi:MAG: hypothetical protein R6V35_00750 [Candidatus Nanohaloarchaea archaeon]